MTRRELISTATAASVTVVHTNRPVYRPWNELSVLIGRESVTFEALNLAMREYMTTDGQVLPASFHVLLDQAIDDAQQTEKLLKQIKVEVKR